MPKVIVAEVPGGNQATGWLGVFTDVPTAEAFLLSIGCTIGDEEHERHGKYVLLDPPEERAWSTITYTSSNKEGIRKYHTEQVTQKWVKLDPPEKYTDRHIRFTKAAIQWIIDNAKECNTVYTVHSMEDLQIVLTEIEMNTVWRGYDDD